MVWACLEMMSDKLFCIFVLNTVLYSVIEVSKKLGSIHYKYRICMIPIFVLYEIIVSREASRDFQYLIEKLGIDTLTFMRIS